MKAIYSLLVLMMAFQSCALKVDQAEAKSMAEGLLEDLKNENYDNLDKYFTGLSNESQSLQKKIERYRQLADTTGKIMSYELLEAKETYESVKGINEFTLDYKVVCSNVTVKHTFLFINDEGTSRILFHNIENMK
jgi:hypothetical protein